MKPALEIYRPPSKQLYQDFNPFSCLDFSLLSDIRLDLPQNKLNVHAQEFTMNMQGLELQNSRFGWNFLRQNSNHPFVDPHRTYLTHPEVSTRSNSQSPAATCTISFKWLSTTAKYCNSCSSSSNSECLSNLASIRSSSSTLAWRFTNHHTCH